MDITPENLHILFRSIDLRFQDAFKTSPDPAWNQIATEIPSASESNIYAWLERVPRFREWSGGRIATGVGGFSQIVTNRHDELTITIPADKIRDDQYGYYQSITSDVARQAKMWYDTLLFGSSGPVRNGQNIPTYDGVNFFSASHPSNYYAGNAVNVNQSNYVSSGGALTADNLTSARAAMMSYLGPDGLPLGVVPDTLLVPPALYTVGMQLTTADTLAMQSFGGISQVGGSSNVLKGLLKVVETPLLSGDPTAWYLLDTGARGGLGGSIRPFIVQNRQAPVVVQKFNAQDENVYRYNAFEWGADIRGQVSQSHWFLAYKSVA